MNDAWGRRIDYMRISITDRCNLRCRYCMPTARENIPHDDILRYEEILRICALALKLGITRFKVTGGEPLVRRGAPQFVRALKELQGVESVTLTSNGLLLEDCLNELDGIDAVNISLDALDEEIYRSLSGHGGAQRALAAVKACSRAGILTKINTVLLEENASEWMEILNLASELPVAVRFIELMPLGYARSFVPVPMERLMQAALARYPDLHPAEVPGNGPARYWGSKQLQGNLGCIAANTHRFCEQCNRIRLSSTGTLHTCLGREDQLDLRTLIRQGGSDEEIADAIRGAVWHKPKEHDFGNEDKQPAKHMHEIGG